LGVRTTIPRQAPTRRGIVRWCRGRGRALPIGSRPDLPPSAPICAESGRSGRSGLFRGYGRRRRGRSVLCPWRGHRGTYPCRRGPGRTHPCHRGPVATHSRASA
jgi:hypothetical protein